MKIKGKSLRGITKRAKKIAGIILEKIGSENSVILTVLILTYSAGVMLRILPARWGIYLNEFDPFYEYYLAKKIAERGWSGFLWWFMWWFDRGEPDKLFWYPQGRDLRATSEVGISMISAAIFLLAKTLGFNVTLYVIHALVPVFFASLIPITLYLLTSEVFNKQAGLFAASFSAFSIAFLSRTPLGGKHESVAIPFMLLSMYFFIKAIKSRNKISGALSGMFLGLMAWSWGAYLYAWNIVALYTLLLWFLQRYDSKKATVFLVFYLVSSAMLAIFPRIGYRKTFLSFSGLMPLAATIVSIGEILSGKLAEKGSVKAFISRRRIQYAILACIVLLAIIGWYSGFFMRLSGRIMAIIFPAKRGALVESVQEHRIPTWSMLYNDYGFLSVVAIAGAAISIKKWRDEDIFLVLLFITSLYAAASMARLTLLLASPLYACAAVALYELIHVALKIDKVPKRERNNVQAYSALLTLAVIALVVIASSLGLLNMVFLAEQPPLIATSALGHSPIQGDYMLNKMDWIATLEWMKINLPQNSVIACWWDYGYWISVNTNMSTICDNATLNSTQIELMAKAFLSNETEALKIFKRLGATHVVVFQPFGSATARYGTTRIFLWYPGGGGDFEKSYTAMVRIAGFNESKYFNWIRVEGATLLAPANTPEARNATLFRLVFIRTPERRLFIFNPLARMFARNFEGEAVEIPPPKHFKLLYLSPRGWVFVYKIEYPKSPEG